MAEIESVTSNVFGAPKHSDLLAMQLEQSEEDDHEQLDTAWAMAEILTAAGNLLETATELESERVEKERSTDLVFLLAV